MTFGLLPDLPVSFEFGTPGPDPNVPLIQDQRDRFELELFQTSIRSLIRIRMSS
jgi:hypothetical protein